MVATRRLSYSTPMQDRGSSSSQDRRMPLTPIRDSYTAAVLARARNAPPEQQCDPDKDCNMVNSLMQQADRIFPGGFIQGKAGHTAEYLEDGMMRVMQAANTEEAVRVLLREGDEDLEDTVFEDVIETVATEEAPAVVLRTESAVVFTKRWVSILFSVLSTLVKSKDLQAVVKKYSRTRGRRAAYLHVLDILDTKFYGTGGKSVALQELVNQTLVGKTDPACMFDEVRSLWMRYNRMSSVALEENTVATSAIGAIKRNDLYANFIQTYVDLEDTSLEEFEQRAKHYYFEFVRHMSEPATSNVLTAADIGDVLDKAFAISVDKTACPFCKGPLVYHKFRDCPTLLKNVLEGGAYNSGEIDPKWHTDNFGREQSQSVSKPYAVRQRPQAKQPYNRNTQNKKYTSPMRAHNAHVANSVERANTSHRVQKVEVHPPPARQLTPDVRLGSNDVRIGERSYFDGIEFRDEGVALAAVVTKPAKIRPWKLEQERARARQDDFLRHMDEQHSHLMTVPCIAECLPVGLVTSDSETQVEDVSQDKTLQDGSLMVSQCTESLKSHPAPLAVPVSEVTHDDNFVHSNVEENFVQWGEHKEFMNLKHSGVPKYESNQTSLDFCAELLMNLGAAVAIARSVQVAGETPGSKNVALRVDSNAVRHFISNFKMFKSFDPGGHFSAAAGTGISSRAVGMVEFEAYDVQGEQRVVTLHDENYVPHKPHNMVAVCQLTRGLQESWRSPDFEQCAWTESRKIEYPFHFEQSEFLWKIDTLSETDTTVNGIVGEHSLVAAKAISATARSTFDLGGLPPLLRPPGHKKMPKSKKVKLARLPDIAPPDRKILAQHGLPKNAFGKDGSRHRVQ